jgi:hypothetical protein
MLDRKFKPPQFTPHEHQTSWTYKQAAELVEWVEFEGRSAAGRRYGISHERVRQIVMVHNRKVRVAQAWRDGDIAYAWANDPSSEYRAQLEWLLEWQRNRATLPKS